MMSILYMSFFCSTLVCCYWCISVLIIIPVVRWCFLIGSHKSAVVLFDRGYPSFGISIPLSLLMLLRWSLIWIASMTLRVYVGVKISKLNLAPNRNMPRLVSVLRNRRGLSTSKLNVSVMFFYPFSYWSPSFTDIHFAAFAWDLVNDTVLFW